MSTRIHIALVALLLSASQGTRLLAQPITPTFFHVTPSPSRPVALPDGSLLIGKRALAPNTGSIVFLDPVGDEATIVAGLPYAGSNAYPAGDANGDGLADIADIFYLINRVFATGPAPVPGPLEPDGMTARGDTLYIATGEVVPAPQKASAKRGAVLRITFSAGLGFHEHFILQSEDYAALLQGQSVVLTHTGPDTATVTLLVNGFPVISDLMVDETTKRLFIVSRADSSVSTIPLE